MIFFRGGFCYASHHRCLKINIQRMHIQIYIQRNFFNISNKRVCFIKILHTRPPQQRPTQNQKLLTEEQGWAALPLPKRFSNPLTTSASVVLCSFNDTICTGIQKKKKKGFEQCPVLCCGLSTTAKKIWTSGVGG